MLINCLECAHEISDKAVMCPHCGYPMKKPTTNMRSKQNKRKRLPNGFGQISEIKNQNLRKPYRAMITVGKTETGRPICKLLKPEAYFETYNEAYIALMDYHRDPLGAAKEFTVEQVYNSWIDIEWSENPVRARKFSYYWKYLQPHYNTKFSEIRVPHIKETMNYLNPTNSTIRELKVFWSLLFKYALEYDITDKNYAKLCTIPKSQRYTTDGTAHKSFTDEEIQKLLQSNDPFAEIIIFQCFTGFRPSEVCDLLRENVDLDNWFITGGSKTEAGTDRLVPVHPQIRAFITRIITEQTVGGYLFEHNARKVTYSKYGRYFKKCLENCGIDPSHKPHDSRKHFITMAKKYNMDEYALKRIVGHSISDLTEKVYTDRNKEWLMSEMLKIPTIPTV